MPNKQFKFKQYVVAAETSFVPGIAVAPAAILYASPELICIHDNVAEL